MAVTATGPDEGLVVAGSTPELVSRIKEDLRARFARGERPRVAEYLERHPELCDASDRVVSLVYEEYCLLEEVGGSVDPEQFCDGYDPWRDSLLSQLRYHEALTRLASSPPRSKARFPEPGERFTRFRLEEPLGRGGAGRVYLARDEELGGRRVALKISTDRGNEASIQGRLDHPHIVPVTGISREPETGLRGLCMPYWPGLSLDRVIEKLAPSRTRPRKAAVLADVLPAARADAPADQSGVWQGFSARASYEWGVAWIVLKLAEALAYAHEQGILHRDIKPANVLLTRRAGPLLLDFNLSQAEDTPEEADEVARGGTLPYMAPEQLAAFLDPACWADLKPATDVFALGMVLRELLTGERPSAPDRDLPLPRMIRQILDKRESSNLTHVRHRNRRVPYGLEAILARCLASSMADRYKSASQLATDLRRFLERRPLVHAVNPSWREVVTNHLQRRRRSILVGLGLTLATTIGLSGYRTTQFVVHNLPSVILGASRITGNTSPALASMARTILENHATQGGGYEPWEQIGGIEHESGRYDEAIRAYGEALRAAKGRGDVGPEIQARILRSSAGSRLELASRRQAELMRRLSTQPRDDSQNEADIRGCLPEIRSQFREALTDLGTAMELSQGSDANDVYLVYRRARCHLGLGDLSRTERDDESARHCYLEARSVIENASDRVRANRWVAGLDALVQSRMSNLEGHSVGDGKAMNPPPQSASSSR
jgi:serine/threonine protein kinase